MATRVDHVRDELKALKAYGRLGRAKARLGEANTLTSDDFLDDAGGGNVLLAVGARRKRRARLERRFNQASDLPPEREARRFAEAPPIQALAPLDKVHSSYPWDVQCCVEIKILLRVRAESSRQPPLHRRDASMAWRCASS